MPTRKNLFLFAAIAIAVSTLFSCKNDAEKKPDTSAVKLDLKTYRIDKELFALDTNHIGEGLQQLNVKYPDFLNFYLDTIMAFGVHGNYSDTTRAIRESLHEYLTYKDYVNLEDTINKYYPDTKDVEAQFTSGFKLMKYYFPAYHVPRIFYLNFILTNHPSFVVDSNTVCVCLDMFLGPQFPYYASVGVPDYMAPHLRKSYMPVSLFTSVYNAAFPFMPDDRPLLDQMIQKGKEKYFLHKIMPDMPDSLLFGFTQNQINFCNKNEAQVYNFFIQQNLLFNKETMKITPYVNDGPFAKGIGSATDPGKPTPGNIGSWMGYRIVSSYMAQYPKTTLKDLLNQRTDAARFLDSARYKPRPQ